MAKAERLNYKLAAQQKRTTRNNPGLYKYELSKIAQQNAFEIVKHDLNAKKRDFV